VHDEQRGAPLDRVGAGLVVALAAATYCWISCSVSGLKRTSETDRSSPASRLLHATADSTWWSGRKARRGSRRRGCGRWACPRMRASSATVVSAAAPAPAAGSAASCRSHRTRPGARHALHVALGDRRRAGLVHVGAFAGARAEQQQVIAHAELAEQVAPPRGCATPGRFARSGGLVILPSVAASFCDTGAESRVAAR